MQRCAPSKRPVSSTQTCPLNDGRPARRRAGAPSLRPPSRRKRFAPSTINGSTERERGRTGPVQAVYNVHRRHQRFHAVITAASGATSPRGAALLGSAERHLNGTPALVTSSTIIIRSIRSDGLTPDHPSCGCRGSRGVRGMLTSRRTVAT
ncbi:uncharacterized protein LOC144946525 [Lampetra fluviatilis]